MTIHLGRWWRLASPPAPYYLSVRETEGLWELVADGTPVGVVYTEGAAKWIVTVHDLLPELLVELEDALYVRDLALGRLRRLAPHAAHDIITNEAPTEWTASLGDIVERMLEADLIEPDDQDD